MDKEAQEKIARWYYYKISAVHISKEEIVAWERLNESAREFYRKEADQILALIPDIPKDRHEMGIIEALVHWARTGQGLGSPKG